jgi:signal transduction histidine kinase
VLSLEVADNGRGLSSEDLAKARSFGLRGLHERAGTVGGWVEVSSEASGTTLLLSVPVPVRPRGSAAGAEGVEDDADHDPSVWGER